MLSRRQAMRFTEIVLFLFITLILLYISRRNLYLLFFHPPFSVHIMEVLVFCIFLASVGVAIFFLSKIRKKSIILPGILILILALSLRIASIEAVHTYGYQQFGEAGDSLRYAELMKNNAQFTPTNPIANTVHARGATYWTYHAIVSSLLFKVFGSSVLLSLVINAIVDSLSAFLLFLVARKLTATTWPAIGAGVLYAVCPPLILYINVFSGEFLAIFFLLFGVYLAIVSFERYFSISVHMILLFIGIGAAFALSDVFKPLIMIVLIAASITLLWSWAKESQMFEKSIAHKYLNYAFFLLLLISSFFTCKAALNIVYIRYVNVTPSIGVSYFLPTLVGLTGSCGVNGWYRLYGVGADGKNFRDRRPDADAALWEEFYSFRQRVWDAQSSEDIARLDSEIRERIYVLLKDNREILLPMLHRRFDYLSGIDFGYENIRHGLWLATPNIADRDSNFFSNLSGALSSVHYLILSLIVTCACIQSLLARNAYFNHGVFFLCVSLFGITIVLLSILMITRYKMTLFMPLLFMLSAYGFNSLADLWRWVMGMKGEKVHSTSK